jgi:ribosomal protein L32
MAKQEKVMVVICPKCGSHMVNGSACPDCGNLVEIENPTEYKYKSKGIAFSLCLFFGIIGVHEFYLGNVGKGLLKMFTLNFVGFGWLYDMNLLYKNKCPDSNGRPLL